MYLEGPPGVGRSFQWQKRGEREMSSVSSGDTPNVLVVGVKPEEKRLWFPVVTGLSVVETGVHLPGRIRAGLGRANYLLLGGELSDSQVAILRRKAQEKGIHHYGPSDGEDLGRMAHRLFGLVPPPCRSDKDARGQCEQVVFEAWVEIEALKGKLAEFDPAEIAALRSSSAASQGRIEALEAALCERANELQGRLAEISRLSAALADVQGKEAGATARAKELHSQLEDARNSTAQLRDEQVQTVSELGKAREELAGAKARLEQTLTEIQKIRGAAEASVRAARDRSSADWAEALGALAREPGLKETLKAREGELKSLREKFAEAKKREEEDARRIRQLEKDLAVSQAQASEFARLKAALGTMLSSKPSAKSRKRRQ